MVIIPAKRMLILRKFLSHPRIHLQVWLAPPASLAPSGLDAYPHCKKIRTDVFLFMMYVSVLCSCCCCPPPYFPFPLLPAQPLAGGSLSHESGSLPLLLVQGQFLYSLYILYNINWIVAECSMMVYK